MAGREKEAWTCGMAYCRGQGVCLCVSVISNSACHSNRSKGHGPPQLCVHTLNHLPPHWSIVAGLFIRAEGLEGYQYAMFLPSLCQILPLGLNTLFSAAYGLWIPVVKTRRPFPWAKRASSRAASAPPHSHSPPFGQSCKAGPWESPASTLIHSAQLCSRGCPASSFIPATAHPGRAKPDWQSPVASRASVSFPSVAAHHPSQLFNLRSN